MGGGKAPSGRAMVSSNVFGGDRNDDRMAQMIPHARNLPLPVISLNPSS